MYTVGQRKRLPASDTGPLYVIKLEPSTNTVVVGEDGELFARSFLATHANWIAIGGLDAPLDVSARIRYNGTASPARIAPGGDGVVRCDFDIPQRAITPGQAAVFYMDDCVVGGGTIEETIDK